MCHGLYRGRWYTIIISGTKWRQLPARGWRCAAEEEEEEEEGDEQEEQHGGRRMKKKKHRSTLTNEDG